MSQLADRATGGRVTKRDFTNRLNRYTSTGESAVGDGEILTDAFLKSAGAWLTEGSQRIAATAGKSNFNDAQDFLHLWQEPGSMQRTLGELNENGYAILDTKLDPDVVAQLADYFSQAPCTLTSDRKIDMSPDDRFIVDMNNPVAEKYAVDTNAILSNELVRKMLLDRGLLEVAQNYLGSTPIVDIVTAWYSFPSDSPSHEAAQLFHFDLDRVRWLKVFFLLTDQTVDTGAHLYIPGTHRDGGISSALLAKGYARLEDDEVAEHHPQENWKSMVAPAGSILLEDTRGLHKGISLKRDHRLMLQFEYAQTLFGHKPFLATVPLDDYQDEYWNSMKHSHPELFAALIR
jgi:ectoine hydroxylase-related dioxygenase (phytanoyl-CoA dioxygenase family)